MLIMAAYELCKGTGMGLEASRNTVRRRLIDAFRGSGHRWMWDYHGLAAALAEHGFVNIRPFEHGKCDDEMFLRPERGYQFQHAVALECLKP